MVECQNMGVVSYLVQYAIEEATLEWRQMSFRGTGDATGETHFNFRYIRFCPFKLHSVLSFHRILFSCNIGRSSIHGGKFLDLYEFTSALVHLYDYV